MACVAHNVPVVQILLSQPRINVMCETVRVMASAFFLSFADPLIVPSQQALGETPLLLSAKCGFAVLVNLLILDGRSDYNKQNKKLQSPMWIAAAEGACSAKFTVCLA